MSVRSDHRQIDLPTPLPRRDSATRGIRALVIGLLLIQAVVALLNLTPFVEQSAVGEILNVNREATAIVWLTSAMLWTIALLAVYAAAANWSIGVSRRGWMGWLVIAGGFSLLSVDETSQLHERIGDKFSDFVQVPFLPHLYSWVLIVAPIALIGAIWMLKWISATVGSRSTTTRLAAAAVGVWVLVPGFEMLDPTLGAPDWLIVAEETCETLGATLFLAAMLIYLREKNWLRLPKEPGPSSL